MLLAIKKSQFWFAAALLIIIAAVAYGQTFRGAINGTVSDATGAVVPKANVTVTNTGTSVSQSMVTTTDGAFSFQDLPPGPYSVAVNASGFQPVTVSNITVTAGQVYTVPVRLTVGQTTTAVEVSGGRHCR